MNLVVPDAQVLIDAFHGNRAAARLLVLLAYGQLTEAVGEDAAVAHWLQEHPGAEIAGDWSEARLTSLREWQFLHDELDGLPDDWGLVTSQHLLHEVRSEIDRTRYRTRLDGYAVFTTLMFTTQQFVTEPEWLAAMNHAASLAVPELPCLMALASGARYVVVSSNRGRFGTLPHRGRFGTLPRSCGDASDATSQWRGMRRIASSFRSGRRAEVYECEEFEEEVLSCLARIDPDLLDELFRRRALRIVA